MVTNYSMYEGEPPRLYRSVADIGRDIGDIRKKIGEANDRLNIRAVLDSVMEQMSDGEPSEWISRLGGIVAEAEQTLADLEQLNKGLDGLSREMEDTLWVLGRS